MAWIHLHVPKICYFCLQFMNSTINTLYQLYVMFGEEEEESATAMIEKKLDETGEMLSNLQKTQHQRLSQKLPPHLAMLPGPSEKETKLVRWACPPNMCMCMRLYTPALYF
jgi:hypothetical protein